MTQKEKLDSLKKQKKLVENLINLTQINMNQTNTCLKQLEVIKCDKTIEPATVKKLVKSNLVIVQRFVNNMTKELVAIDQKERAIKEGKA